jgi:hypothetical protein
MTADSMYNVVFQYTPAAGAYEGIRRAWSYLSKEEFDKTARPFLAEKGQEVVEEGISNDRVTELCAQTPFTAYLRVVYRDATLPDGTVDSKILERGLLKILGIPRNRDEAGELILALSEALMRYR